jgi:hypothetical protein
MSTTELAAWLRARPKLSAVRVDGDRTVRIVGSRYGSAEATLEALEPTLLEGLDSDGEVVRALRLGADREPAPPLAPTEWPKGQLAELGQVITAACDRASGRLEGAYREAFERLSRLYELQSARLAELEAMHYRALADAAEEAREERDAALQLAQAAQPAGEADALVQHVLAGAAQRALAPAKANGAPGRQEGAS